MALPNEGRMFTTVRMTDHDDWLAFRNTGIGGSDVAGIMGLSSWSSPMSIWAERTGKVAQEDISSKESVLWGTLNEPTIREHFKSLHPELKVLHPRVTMVSVDRPWAHANVDGLLRDQGGHWGVLEIKTTGSRDGWFDDDGEPTIPVYYQTQAAHYLLVTGYSYARFAVLVGGNHYEERDYVPDQEDLDAVRDAVDSFWNDYVLTDIRPALMTGLRSESKALYGLYGDPSDDWVESPSFESKLSEYFMASAEERDARDRKAVLASEIKAEIGDGVGMRTPGFEARWVRSAKRDSGLRVKER